MTYKPHRTPQRDIEAVEPLVRAVYDQIYGPAYWDRKPAAVREGITSFVVESARKGAARCIAHTEPDGTPHYLDPTVVLATLGDPTNEKGR